MEYDRLRKLLETELRLNRKERFYTGTVLPSLLFHRGLSNFYSFLHQIPEFPKEISEKDTDGEFLFYTEYNLKESQVKKSEGIKIDIETGDTPDLIIEILQPFKVFVVIEAKMFANPTLKYFNSQMSAQKKVIDALKKAYDPRHIFHVALVPSQIHFLTNESYSVINWQFFIDNNALDMKENYFYPYLKLALDKYDALVAKKHGKALTIKEEISGSQIYLDGKNARDLYVGRMGGKKVVLNDVKQGIWRNRKYATNTEKPKNGLEGNWLSSAEFAEIVDQTE